MGENLFLKLVESPAIRTFIYALSNVVTGVLCGTLVTEITVDGHLQWSEFYRTWSFWSLVLLLVALYLYYRATFRRESDVMRFAGREYCLAYVRSQCLPEMVEKYKGLVRSGQDVAELEEAMIQIRKIVK